LLAPLAAGAGESLSALLQRLSAQGQLEIAGAAIYQLPVTQAFYEQRGFLEAWTNPTSVRALAEEIQQAGREGMNGQDYHQDQVLGLLDGSLELDAPSRDLLLTDSLERLTYHYALGKVDPQKYVASWNFDRKLPQVDPVTWMGEVIVNGGMGAGLARLKPNTQTYHYLVAGLARYRAIQAAGGWSRVAEGPTLHPGDHDPRVIQLRQRLEAEGILDGTTVTEPGHFDTELELAVTRFQQRYRLDADGVAGKRTISAMNVPIEQRVGQIRVNLERARVLQDIPATAVIVDIAGFEVSMVRDGQRVFQARAQVGRPYRSTPIFSDVITYIEFNPTWTVPPTIFSKDVLPAIKVDPGYLSNKNMQVLSMDGAVIDPTTIDWQLYPRQGFPYMIRQQAGPDNALGRLKIMFPNEYMVYLHDTPSRELFKRNERTFSSGCIRVENAEKLAELLLDEPVQWNLAAINAVIDGRATRRVTLPQPIPIYMAYWTVAVDANGEIEFKLDPYDRDRLILQVLEQPLVPDARRLGPTAASG